MQLHQLSPGYEQTAALLRLKLRALREAVKNSSDPQKTAQLKHEISLYSGIMTQCRELARLTAHYYERSFYRDEKYCL